jgi:hypothetical protein
VESCKLRHFNSFEFFDHTGTRLFVEHLNDLVVSTGCTR